MDIDIEFAEWIFTSLILVVASGISAHICHGYGTLRWKETFIGLVFFIMIVVQLYHLVLASLFIPNSPYIFNDPLYRKICLISDKGGKHPRDSHEPYDLNPCFCHAPSECFNVITGVVLNRNDTCPRDGTAACRARLPHHQDDNSSIFYEIPLYLNHRRDCAQGEGSLCSLSQPCDPCLRSELPLWRSGRCRTCTSDNLGLCGFVEGIGPYCREDPNSRSVVPCSRCCTEGERLFVNGTCF
mmetsp:Transcript_14866/g.14973  ORF Transcript_14866/g.14973 Transcript_14866/m.14973 type:complete len:241 (-) Transcript_14866:65-787(-)